MGLLGQAAAVTVPFCPTRVTTASCSRCVGDGAAARTSDSCTRRAAAGRASEQSSRRQANAGGTGRITLPVVGTRSPPWLDAASISAAVDVLVHRTWYWSADLRGARAVTGRRPN